MYGLRYRGALDSTTQAELEGLVATLQEFLLREHNEDGTHRSTESQLAPVPIGGVIAWTTLTPPEGWLLCDGAAVSRTTHARLFKAIGTTFGAGDGVLTFNVPNMRGQYLMGVATSGTGSTIGAVFGSSTHTHAIIGEDNHSHTYSGTTDDENNSISFTEGEGEARQGADDDHTHAYSGTTNGGGEHDHGGETGTGGSHPPSIAVNWIILAGR